MEEDMISSHNRRLGLLLAVGLAGYGIGGCASSGGGDTGEGGSGGTGNVTGGPAGASGGHGPGGSTAAAGSGPAGSTGLAGSSVAGTTGTGGTVSNGGSGPAGNDGRGGTESGGEGGAKPGRGGTTGGPAGTGGTIAGGGGRGGATAGLGGSTGVAGSGVAGSGAAGSGNPGTCQKGQTKGSDVAILGESFYAISPQYIQNRIQDNARKAGSLGASDTYHNVAVSGQNMNYIATTEWTAATANGGMPKWIIMDGGGIDCLNGGSSACSTCSNTFKTLLGKMGTAGVKEVIYTRYPEPGNPPGSNATLKSCLDATMPMMQTTCEGSTSPKCHWVDLRPVWVNGDTSDGLHPTQSGGNHVGDLIWSEMMKECFAQ
jgi:hypothetical protein